MKRKHDEVALDSQEHPWRDKELLERLYVDEELTQPEVADILGCHTSTISTWLRRHGIPTRRPVHVTAAIEANRVKWASYCLNDEGYPKWHSNNPDGTKDAVFVHRLLAVAIYGIEAVRDSHIHHKNGIRWDNRPDNIELIEPSEHHRLHANEQDRANGGEFI